MFEILNQPYSSEYLEERLIDLFLPEGNANGRCILFIHGDRDETIPLSHSAKTCNKINGLGGSAQLVRLEGVGHGFGYGITTQAQIDAVHHAELFLEKLFKEK